MTLAVLCSGQGPQHRDMFDLTGNAPGAANLFAHAAALCGGNDPRTTVQTDTDDGLHRNRVGQILCTLQSLAAASILRDVWPRRLVIAGYSVGEVAAWGVAGLLDSLVTLDLAARRADLMDTASMPGDGLLFVRCGFRRDGDLRKQFSRVRHIGGAHDGIGFCRRLHLFSRHLLVA